MNMNQRVRSAACWPVPAAEKKRSLGTSEGTEGGHPWIPHMRMEGTERGHS